MNNFINEMAFQATNSSHKKITKTYYRRPQEQIDHTSTGFTTGQQEVIRQTRSVRSTIIERGAKNVYGLNSNIKKQISPNQKLQESKNQPEEHKKSSGPFHRKTATTDQQQLTPNKQPIGRLCRNPGQTPRSKLKSQQTQVQYQQPIKIITKKSPIKTQPNQIQQTNLSKINQPIEKIQTKVTITRNYKQQKVQQKIQQEQIKSTGRQITRQTVVKQTRQVTKQLPSKQLPARQLPTKQITTKQRPSKQLSSKQTLVKEVITKQVSPRQIQSRQLIKQQPKQIPKQEVKQVKQPPKRSKLIFFSLVKYYNSNIIKVFDRLKQTKIFKNTKNSIYSKILTNAIVTINNSYDLFNKSQVFRRLKLIIIKSYSQGSKNISTQINNNIQKKKNIVCVLLEVLFKEQLRACFKKMDNNRQKRRLISKAVGCLAFIEKRKIFQGFNKFIQNAKAINQSKTRKINQFYRITKKFYAAKKIEVFQKLVVYNLPKITKKTLTKKSSMNSNLSSRSMTSHPSQSQIMPISHTQSPTKSPSSFQKQGAVFIPTEKSIQVLKQRIQENKDSFETQKRNLQQLLQDLRNLINQNTYQVSHQTQNNEQLKDTLNKLGAQSGPDLLEIDDQKDSKLAILSQIYRNLTRTTGAEADQISINTIIQQHKLNVNLVNEDQNLKCWEIMKINSQLKRTLQKIQGLTRERKTVIILQQQHRVIQNLVRSYIKERYLWEWVRNSIGLS